jgi:hypothetical protein
MYIMVNLKTLPTICFTQSHLWISKCLWNLLVLLQKYIWGCIPYQTSCRLGSHQGQYTQRHVHCNKQICVCYGWKGGNSIFSSRCVSPVLSQVGSKPLCAWAEIIKKTFAAISICFIFPSVKSFTFLTRLVYQEWLRTGFHSNKREQNMCF